MEQSSCFVFKDGRVHTYNDEVSCSTETHVRTEGAVCAKPLLEVLRKMTEDEVELTPKDEELIVTGTRRRAGIRMERNILLSLDSVEPPGKWRKLPNNFCEALGMVHGCTSKDQSRFNLCCVHVHPKWVEACDNIQLARFEVKIGVKESFLLRREVVEDLVECGVTEISETECWVHFRNSNGLVISGRRYAEDYPDLTRFLEVEGAEMELPQEGLAEAIEKANIFSSENTAEHNQVLIELKPGALRINGRGVTGWYQEVKKLKYDGPELSFLIEPELLNKIIDEYRDCEVSDDRLLVRGEHFRFVTSLGKV